MAQIAEIVTIDRDANAAYIWLSHETSVRTEVLNDFVNVDLDNSNRIA